MLTHLSYELISEATHISPEGTPIWHIYPAVADGSYQVPGIWTDEHIAAWKVVTDAVHAKGALMCCQLLHHESVRCRESSLGIFSLCDVRLPGVRLRPGLLCELEDEEVVTEE